MKRWGERLICWLCDPAWHDEILGDLEELRDQRRRSGGRRAQLRYGRDVASIVVRRVRPRHAGAPARYVIPALIGTIGLIAITQRGDAGAVRTIFAHDDAGRFTLDFAGQQVVAATLDGRPLPKRRITQVGNVVRLHGANRGGDLLIHVTAAGGIEWNGRSPQ